MIVPSERYLEALIHANRTTLVLYKINETQYKYINIKNNR